MKNKPIIHPTIILGLIFAALLIIIPVINLIAPDREISEIENRALAQRPSLNGTALLEGTFSDDFESYESDQFAGRDLLRSVQVFFRWLGGSREENGIYLGRDGRLLEKIVIPEEALLQNNAAAVNDFAEAHPDLNISFMMVPDAASVYPDDYPAFAERNDQRSCLQDFASRLDPAVRWIDLLPVLESHADEGMYYKTDHHWTTAAAHYAYQVYAKENSLQEAVFKSYPVTDCFTGALSRSTGFCMSETEVIDIFVPDAPEDLVVSYVNDRKRTTSLYDSSMLDGSDPYQVFMGGNYSLIDIQTAADTDDTLLLFKDSFANCFIPFLTQHYSRIIVVDPRYYYGNANDLVNTYAVTDVLFLYSGNTFFRDNNLPGALAQ